MRNNQIHKTFKSFIAVIAFVFFHPNISAGPITIEVDADISGMTGYSLLYDGDTIKEERQLVCKGFLPPNA